MAYLQTGVEIIIKAFLPAGKTLDEQLAALSMVKDAHETGDYSKVLAAANIEKVKAEPKTKRVEDKPTPASEDTAQTEKAELEPQGDGEFDEEGQLYTSRPTESGRMAYIPAGEDDIPPHLDRRTKR